MGIDTGSGVSASRGGRGARERILQAAQDLFYQRGIANTGVDQIAEHANASKRTLYNHYPTKNALVDAYLRSVDTPDGIPRERPLNDTDSPARARLLGIFDARPDLGTRGCPFHNAAVEAAGTLPEVHHIVVDHKRAFIETLVAACAEVGARNPRELGHQLAVLFEGATALTTSLGETSPFIYAQSAAAALIDATTGSYGS
ncbi:TetR/AcrR family transcriptional regulator [Mycolicibacterium cosmeticum]|uniref:TetR/AcrR family transcriptional regulator n=1 Tax=Mycolicibacterium cosmeticum TaxID=258533 RepID=UPI003204E7E0